LKKAGEICKENFEKLDILVNGAGISPKGEKGEKPLLHLTSL